MPRVVDPFYRELGRRIQGERIRKKLTQEHVGERLIPAVRRASIANVERGKQRILVHTLIQICQILECDVSDLLPIDSLRAPKDVKTRVTNELTKLKLSNRTVQRISRELGTNWRGATK